MESQHWTCLACSIKSIVSRAEIQYCSSISVNTRGPIINKHYYWQKYSISYLYYSIGTESNQSHRVIEYKSKVYPLDINFYNKLVEYYCQYTKHLIKRKLWNLPILSWNPANMNRDYIENEKLDICAYFNNAPDYKYLKLWETVL